MLRPAHVGVLAPPTPPLLSTPTSRPSPRRTPPRSPTTIYHPTTTTVAAGKNFLRFFTPTLPTDGGEDSSSACGPSPSLAPVPATASLVYTLLAHPRHDVIGAYHPENAQRIQAIATLLERQGLTDAGGKVHEVLDTDTEDKAEKKVDPDSDLDLDVGQVLDRVLTTGKGRDWRPALEAAHRHTPGFLARFRKISEGAKIR